MKQSVGRDSRAGSPTPGGAALVAEIRVFLEAWQHILRGETRWVPREVEGLRRQSRALQARSLAADVGGLAHHLGTCEQCLSERKPDRAKLSECLRNVSEVAWQLRQELESRQADVADKSTQADAAPKSTGRQSSRVDDVIPPPPAWIMSSHPPPAVDAGPSIDAGSSPELESFGRQLRPPSLLGSLLGLRAFGGRRKVDDAEQDDTGQAAGGHSKPPRIGPDLSGLPDLSAVPDLSAPPNMSAFPVLDMSAFPVMKGGPELPARQPLAEDLELRVERIRQAGRQAPPPEQILSPEEVHRIAQDSSQPLAAAAAWGRRKAIPGIPWWSGPLVVVVLGLVAVLVLESRRPRSSPRVTSIAASPLGASADPASALPSPRLTDEAEKLSGLLAQVHGHGGLESPELADLLDEEAALLGQALRQPCVVGSATCQLIETARELLTPRSVQPTAPRAAPGKLGLWLSGLKLPGIGIKDTAVVRELVAFHTENTVGRETFQIMLFQCGAYQDLFQQLLVRHGLPLDLVALAMVESGCVSDIESPVGARGLWQFMPATARAYHLRVTSGVIDERISPTKSTDAAVRFLRDLHRKMGSWELALASYNMGPFGLLARLRQAGGQLDFWDLAEAGRLPKETAAYVPKVQAFALILANLKRFRFETAQLKAPEVTADLEVPPGTRLGLVARAAASSITRIRELNPDIVGDGVPELPGEPFVVRVPKEGSWRARQALAQLIAAGDRADRCVPHSFDWGEQRFTPLMASRCRELAYPAARPVSASRRSLRQPTSPH